MTAAATAGLDPDLPALVVHLDPNPFHHGALGAVRSLGRAGVPVHAVVGDRWSATRYSRYARSTWRWQPDLTDTESVVAGLLEVGQALGRAVPIAVDDLSAALLAEHADRLRPHLVMPVVPADLPRALADKTGFAEICAQHGLPTAASATVSSDEDVEELLSRTSPPYAVKLARPWTDAASGVPRVSRVDSAAEVLEMRRRAGTLLVQEWIPNSPDGDVSFVGVFDEDGGCLFAGASVKVRAYPSGGGMTCCGRTVDLPEVLELARTAARAVGFAGVCDMDFRRDPRDGSYRLLDFNPRLGATSRLYEQADGTDAVRALHLMASGRDVPTAPVPAGRVFLVEQYDVLSARHYLRSEGLRGWLRPMRGERELAWYAGDDRAPFALMVGRGLARAAGRRLGPADGRPPQRLQPPLRRPAYA